MDIQGLYDAVTEQFNKRHHIAHDIKHATRVAAMCKYIAEQEDYNSQEAEIAGLLHDMGRTVREEEKGHGPAGVPLSRKLLGRYTNYDTETKERILFAIEHHSELYADGTLTHIVQDADKLDGMGAIGIMRAYTSKAQLPDYDPDNIIPSKGMRDVTIHEQIAWQMTHIDFMYTDTAKRIAKSRHAFMQQFLEEFRDEVEMRAASFI